MQYMFESVSKNKILHRLTIILNTRNYTEILKFRLCGLRKRKSCQPHLGASHRRALFITRPLAEINSMLARHSMGTFYGCFITMLIFILIISSEILCILNGAWAWCKLLFSHTHTCDCTAGVSRKNKSQKTTDVVLHKPNSWPFCSV